MCLQIADFVKSALTLALAWAVLLVLWFIPVAWMFAVSADLALIGLVLLMFLIWLNSGKEDSFVAAVLNTSTIWMQVMMHEQASTVKYRENLQKICQGKKTAWRVAVKVVSGLTVFSGLFAAWLVTLIWPALWLVCTVYRRIRGVSD